MCPQAPSLTSPLAEQLVRLVWLARRYQASELYWLLKLVLAVVVARLTFNPWLDNYQAASHWTLLTYVGAAGFAVAATWRSEEHTSELQSRPHLVCRLLLEKRR